MNGWIKGLIISAALVLGSAVMSPKEANAANRHYYRPVPGYAYRYDYYPQAYSFSYYRPGYYYPGNYYYSWPGFTYFRAPAVVYPRTYYYWGPNYTTRGPRDYLYWR